MGPKALQVRGGLADGTLPSLAGQETIAEFVEPAIAKSAADSGQPTPRIIASVPAVASDNVDAAKTLNAERRLNLYETIPSYQQLIAREGVAPAWQTLPRWVERNRSGIGFRAIWMRVRPIWCYVGLPGTDVADAGDLRAVAASL